MESASKLITRLKIWARGSPPMDDKVYQTIHDEFRVILYVSCFFMDLREWNWILSVILITVYHFVMYASLFLFSALAYVLRDDFVEASHNLHMAFLYVLLITVVFFATYHRTSLMAFLKAWSVNFFNYEDDFQIPEMDEEVKRSKKFKKIVIIAVPSYIVMTGVVCLLGRSMDEYTGVATNETYVGSVYQKTPMPMWYPFEINTYGRHLMVTGLQFMGSNTVAMTGIGAASALIFCSQALAIQLKTVLYRVRKIEEWVYQIYKENGGERINPTTLYSDPDFLKCYNQCLIKIARHHLTIIENFRRMEQLCWWPAGAAVVLGSLIIAMSIFTFLLGGGRPSMVSLVIMLLIAEIANMAVMCYTSEELAELGESLHEELYDLKWMQLDMPAKRKIMIMIERSKQPLLYKGGIALLNWKTFSKIMETSYSYLNLLIAFKGV